MTGTMTHNILLTRLQGGKTILLTRDGVPKDPYRRRHGPAEEGRMTPTLVVSNISTKYELLLYISTRNKGGTFIGTTISCQRRPFSQDNKDILQNPKRYIQNRNHATKYCLILYSGYIPFGKRAGAFNLLQDM